MRILALDSATRACSAAVLTDGSLEAHRYEAMDRGQAERLVPLIQETLAAAGTAFTGLDAIAVTVGPGTYTGVRIGLATARALALAADLPLLGVTTTEAVAAQAIAERSAVPEASERVVVALETKRADFYIQVFTPDRVPIAAPASVMPADASAVLPAKPLVLTGDAALRLHALLSDRRDVSSLPGPLAPDAVHVARIAAARIATAPEPIAMERPEPLYLRPPDVTLPRHRSRQA